MSDKYELYLWDLGTRSVFAYAFSIDEARQKIAEQWTEYDMQQTEKEEMIKELEKNNQGYSYSIKIL